MPAGVKRGFTWRVRTAEHSLHVCTVISGVFMRANIIFDLSCFCIKADSRCSDLTVRMRRLIFIFTGRKCPTVCFQKLGLNNNYIYVMMFYIYGTV